MKNDDLYFMQEKITGRIKIGRSVDPERRLKSLQTGNGNQIRIIAVFKGEGYRESYLHDELARWRGKGEWFNVGCVGSIPVYYYERIPCGAFDNWWETP